MRRVAVLGSTGSVGTQALAVMRLHPDLFRVAALAASSRAEELEAQVERYRPDVALLAHPPPGYKPPSVPGVEWLLGEAAERCIPGCDTVLNAVVGAEGLAASMAAARAGVRLCLANKETVVAGGELFMDAMRAGGGELIPVDSEHSAIFQCIQSKEARPSKLILTASGGPFRAWTKERMAAATPRQALRHPNWDMGTRITIDSATMMNKALEIVEAGHLFGMSAQEIDVLIHPSSIIHSMVQYKDGAVLAQLGAPDMRVPIMYALAYPRRLETGVPPPDLTCAPLAFEAPDRERFPALGLGYEVLRAGGISGAALNAADEVAVQGFLDGRCGFCDIAALCEAALNAVPQVAKPSLSEIYLADDAARRFVARWLDAIGGK